MTTQAPTAATTAGSAPPPPAETGKTGKEGGFFGRESALPGVADATADMPRPEGEEAPKNTPREELESETAVERRERKAKEAKEPEKKKAPKKEARSAEDEGTETADEDVEPAKDGEFEFAGAKWRDASHAEHSFRTLRGQFRAVARREAEAKNLSWQYHEAEKALLAENGTLQARIAELEGGKAPAKGTGKAPVGEAGGEGKSFLDTIDWPMYHELQKRGPAYASAYLAEQHDEYMKTAIAEVEDRLRRELQMRLSPINDAATARRAVQGFTDLFIKASEAHKKNGDFYYPEFQLREGEGEDGEPTPAARRRIEKFTQDLGSYLLQLPAEMQQTPRGFHHAYLAYKDGQPAEEKAPGGDKDVSTADQLLEGVTAAERARATLHGRGTPRASAETPAEKARDFVLRIGQSGTRNPKLGFSE